MKEKIIDKQDNKVLYFLLLEEKNYEFIFTPSKDGFVNINNNIIQGISTGVVDILISSSDSTILFLYSSSTKTSTSLFKYLL